MKSFVRELNSVAGSDLARLDDTQVARFDNVPMNATIVTDSAFMAFRSPWDRDYPNRPYLHLMGQLRALKGTLPYGVNDAVYDKKGPRVDMFYEFTNDQLANLVKKGLYEKGFEVPDLIKNAELELPVSCNVAVVKPNSEVQFPLVFAHVDGLRDMTLTNQNSGYNLETYFENVKDIEAQRQNQVGGKNEREKGVPTLDFGDEQNDVLDFAQDQDQEQTVPEIASGQTASLFKDNSALVHSADEMKHEDDKQEVAPLSDDEKIANELLAKARKRMQKQRQKAKEKQDQIKASEAETKAENDNTEADKPKDMSDPEFSSEVRDNQFDNSQDDINDSGLEQATVPENQFDFENMNDEDLSEDKMKNKRRANKKSKKAKGPSQAVKQEIVKRNDLTVSLPDASQNHGGDLPSVDAPTVDKDKIDSLDFNK